MTHAGTHTLSGSTERLPNAVPASRTGKELARELARELTSPGRLICSHPSCILPMGTQMIRPSLIVLLSWVCSWVCLALPAVAAGVDAAAINGADFGTSKPPPEDRINALVV